MRIAMLGTVCVALAGCGQIATEQELGELQGKVADLETRLAAVESALAAAQTELAAARAKADANEVAIATGLSSQGASIAALQDVTRFMSIQAIDGVDSVVFTGTNVHIRNALGRTECDDGTSYPVCNGKGNLVIGYNELRGGGDTRTGSHFLVVGRANNFSHFGGLVAGLQNEVSGDFASVSGGSNGIAAGDFASVSGGRNNQALGAYSTVSGGADRSTGAFAPGSNDDWVAGGLFQDN